MSTTNAKTVTGQPLHEQADRPYRILPHNLEAEQGLLGALLVDNRALERIDFLRPFHSGQ